MSMDQIGFYFQQFLILKAFLFNKRFFHEAKDACSIERVKLIEKAIDALNELNKLSVDVIQNFNELAMNPKTLTRTFAI